MPKKRHQGNFSKPQSTAPASLSSSSSVPPRSSNHDDHSGRGVNERLAELRRVSFRSQKPSDHAPSLFAAPGAPSLPPAVRRILQIPETPAPPPRRPVRVSRHGLRPPPGPAAPRSWMSGPERAALPSSSSLAPDSKTWQFHGLPGAYHPLPGSLMDAALRKLAIDWEFQRSYNRYYLYSLPTHIKVALIAYLARWYDDGVDISDLRTILHPSPSPEDEAEDMDDGQYPPPSHGAVVNEDLCHLDLTGSLGQSLRLRELFDFLFPSVSFNSTKSPARAQDLQESWDTPSSETNTTITSIPRPLLPNITHLSLAIDPRNAHSVSWRHLLSFASRFPTLSHLSLAYWPEPCLTPNARLTSFTVPSGTGSVRTVQYGGTGPYSHSLDEDWSEAVLVLRRLARNLYGLEWLDLTGCASWALPALTTLAEHDSVDWVGDWGKVSTILLYPRFSPSLLGEELYVTEVSAAPKLERHIRSKRGGVGRPISVETVQT